MTHHDRHRDPDPRRTPGTAAGSGAGQPEPGAAAGRLAYSVEEAALLTGLSRDLLYHQMRLGNLDSIKVGRRQLITRQQLQDFLGIPSQASAP